MPLPDLLDAWAELEAACPDYDEAEEFFCGEVPEVFASQKWRDAISATGDGYRFNFAKTPVTVMADRVEISKIYVPGDEAATAAIEDIFDANDLAVHYVHLLTQCFVFGDAYFMVWPVEVLPTPADETDDELIAAGVEFIYQDPRHCRVIYDPENLRRKKLVLKRWKIADPSGDPAAKPLWRVDLWYPALGAEPAFIEHWQSVREGDMKTEAGWAQAATTDINPYGQVPFFHHRTALPYGKPLHYDAYGPQAALQKLLVTQLSGVDFHGFPQRYGLMDPAAALDSANDAPNWVDDSQAPVTGASVTGQTRGGQGSGIRTGPGTMQIWDGMTEVGQFDPADPKVFLEPVKMYVELMAQMTTTPLHDFNPGAVPPSGESRRVAEAPLVKRIQRQQQLQRAPIQEEWLFALKLAGIGSRKVAVQWTPAQAATDVSDWEVIAAKQEAGVPADQTLTEAGYTNDQVLRWMDKTPEQMSVPQRIRLASELAGVAQGIGTAVSASAMSKALGEQVLGKVFAWVTADGVEQA
jgi:hypothetical protein